MGATINDNDRGLFSTLFVDGRPLLTLGSLGLLFAGGFAIFLAATGQFLPHDVQFLGMTARELCSHDACRIVHFMIHDRVSFGGTLISLSVLYLWLIHFPLAARQPWAWWTICISNGAGFLSFLSYLSYGYLDTWHGVATLLLLPCFAAGLARSYRTLNRPRGARTLLRGAVAPADSAARSGRILLLGTGTAMLVAGLTISIVGMTLVFVPQDLLYMDTTISQLNALNQHLIPLIAHDRAGFGGGVLNVGFIIVACVWCGEVSRHRWQALLISGAIGFGTAIGIHPIVGYDNPVHLAPACLAAVCYAEGIWLTRPRRR
jgi:hypothetical protein